MVTAADLIQNVPSTPALVYLFCPGKGLRAKMPTYEPFLAERAAERLARALVPPENRDFAYGAFYADETEPAAIVNEAQTVPFLSERRVVLVRNAERYNTESQAGPMISYLESPSDITVMLLISDKIDKRTKFYKACAKSGEVVECPALNEREAIQWLLREAREQGCAINHDAAQELVRRAGTRLSDVNNALTIVINFLGKDSSPITAETVLAATADVAEDEIWALTDAIAASRAGDALTVLRRLTDLGKHPDEVIGTINWLLKSAYAVAKTDGEPSISRFVAEKVRPLAAKLGVPKLRDAFALCTYTQFSMRNTGVNAALALELLVVKLAAPAPAKVARQQGLT